MPVTDSPLRYPGGKTKLYSLIRPIVVNNAGENSTYVEPFAGGAGLALKLLFKGDVSRIVLNDVDESIACFWRVCLDDSERFCEMILHCTPSIAIWNEQHQIYLNPRQYPELERAFATLFLNRCNISGVISGGPIGGKGQDGKYKIDARFNPTDLARKVRRIGCNRNNIMIYNMDASIFIRDVVSTLPIDTTILNIDPPYVNKGSMLYRNSYCHEDHNILSQQIQGLHHKWIVTYDVCPLISELYEQCNMTLIELKYSAGQTKSGIEYIITGDNITR